MNYERHLVWHHPVSREERWRATRLDGATVWFTGLSGAGKSTVANEVAHLLVGQGRACYQLDGDNLRIHLNSDLGFDRAGRAENIRRVGEVARLMADAGLVALVPVISPYRADRERVRLMHSRAGLPFVEVYVDTPLEECERRDPKGLYRLARTGVLTGFTGIDDPYEEPMNPELRLSAIDAAPRELAARVVDLLEQAHLTGPTPRP